MNKELVSFLQTLGDSQILLHTIRQQLLKTPNFQVSILFKQISSTKNKLIDIKDLHLYILNKGIHAADEEVFAIFKELDINKKGSISFNDFIYYFSNDKLEYTSFDYGEIDLVKKLFTQIIQNHRSLEKLKNKMSSTPPIQLFKQISKKETEIKLSSLKHSLMTQGVPLQTIESLLNYFKSRGQNSLTLQYFISLLLPYSEIKTDFTSSPFCLNDLLNLKQNIQIKPALLQRLYSEVPTTNLEDFFKLKKIQNKSKRQYIQSHQKSRKELMSNIMQRQNSPKLSIDLNSRDFLNKSQSLPYMKLLSPKQSTIELRHPLSSLSPNTEIIDFPLKQQNKRQDQIQAIKKAYTKLQKQISQNNLQQFSFNPIQRSSNTNNLTELLRKQQQQLQLQRARRIELQNQVMGYKRIGQLEQNRHSFKPIDKVNIDTSYLKYSKNKSPIFRQYAKSINSNRRTRQAGKIQHRGLWPKQYLPKRNHKQNIQQQLRKNRLQRQFSKYKIHKQSEQIKYLWK